MPAIGKLGVGVSGVGWCASQHIAAFQKNPHTAVTWLYGRDEDRTRANLAKYGLTLPEARVTTSYDDLLRRPTSTSSRSRRPIICMPIRRWPPPQAGKHLLLEKPTGLDVAELVRIRDAVRRAGVRTIVSFELRYNPFLKFARWLRDGGLARRDPLRAHAVSLARHRLVQRVGLGAHARERTQPPARRRLPRGRRAALVLGPASRWR